MEILEWPQTAWVPFRIRHTQATRPVTAARPCRIWHLPSKAATHPRYRRPTTSQVMSVPIARWPGLVSPSRAGTSRALRQTWKPCRKTTRDITMPRTRRLPRPAPVRRRMSRQRQAPSSMRQPETCLGGVRAHADSTVKASTDRQSRTRCGLHIPPGPGQYRHDSPDPAPVFPVPCHRNQQTSGAGMRSPGWHAIIPAFPSLPVADALHPHQCLSPGPAGPL